jgi:hypothetical protein
LLRDAAAQRVPARSYSLYLSNSLVPMTICQDYCCDLRLGRYNHLNGFIHIQPEAHGFFQPLSSATAFAQSWRRQINRPGDGAEYSPGTDERRAASDERLLAQNRNAE